MPIIFFSANIAPLVGKNRLMTQISIPEPDSRASWNARLFYLNAKKCVIWTNKATLYSIVTLNVRKKDFIELTSLFLSSLFAQLKHDGLYNEVQENYWLDNITNFVFAKTDNDKKVIGSMNNYTEQLNVGVSHGSTLLQQINNTSGQIILTRFQWV